MNWVSRRKEYEFDRQGGARGINDWQESLEKFFGNWPVTNTTTQARLAILTLTGRANKWWRAHQREKTDVGDLVRTAIRAGTH